MQLVVTAASKGLRQDGTKPGNPAVTVSPGRRRDSARTHNQNPNLSLHGANRTFLLARDTLVVGANFEPD